MQITIDPKARPCPGVENAIALAEDALRRGETVYAVGPLIHNRREVERLEGLGLRIISSKTLEEKEFRAQCAGKCFILRAHGEPVEIVSLAKSCRMKIIDATCPIVRHSHEIVDQHVRDGWRIVIVGNPNHPEVVALLTRAGDTGMVIASSKEAETVDIENRTLVMAQTTVDPHIFSEVRRILSRRISGIKIVDTTCRFLQYRQQEIKVFANAQDVVIFIAGKSSSNGRLLFEIAKSVNPNSFFVEGTSDLDLSFLKDNVRVGISGGASTPRWQFEEMRGFLETLVKENPKGLKNRKGGSFLCWMRKSRPKMG